MGGIWEGSSESYKRIQFSSIELHNSGLNTLISGAETGVVKYVTRISAHQELAGVVPVLLIGRTDASGTTTNVRTIQFDSVSGNAASRPFVWEKPDGSPILDLHAGEYLSTRVTISGAVSVQAEHREYGGLRESRGNVSAGAR
jgi:hypothetical protein